MQVKTLLPVDVVFHPNWWNKNYGIIFQKDFFFDPAVRVENDFLMRKYLMNRFPDLDLVDGEIKHRPVVGATLLAAGYLISAILGCEIKYFDDAPPEVIPKNLNDEQISALKPINIFKTLTMQELLRMIDQLEQKFGYLEGDINWEGVQNVALNLRGQQLFLDYLTNPQLAINLLEVVNDTIIQFLEFMRQRIGSTSLSVNRIIRQVEPALALHSNCTVTMISPDQYRQFLFKYDRQMSEKFSPYGIHYCGNNMHVMCYEFAKLRQVCFYDVGWGSDVQRCREALPDKFLSLRLNPVRMLTEPSEVIKKDIEKLLSHAGDLRKVGLCCINMDYGTPDDNILKIFQVANEYRNQFDGDNKRD
jgi:Uroporphyrinogen decarboxylase (URO-D)